MDHRNRRKTNPNLLGVLLVYPILIGCFSLGIAATSSPSANSSSSSDNISCTFSGRRYEPGTQWYRRLDTPGAVFCVSCQCHDAGKINCTSRPCSLESCPTTIMPEEEDSCCKQCQDSNTDSNLPQTPVSDPPQISCLHNGRIYQDGQVFASNATGLQTQQPNQCVQCVCQGGLVLCRLKTCQIKNCTSFLPSTEDCCPLCQDEQMDMDMDDFPESDSVLITFMDSSRPGRLTQDCRSGGRIYNHGSSWHPIIGPFGQMDCVLCKCQMGTIECSRLSCPPLSAFSCAQPKRQQGQCCPVCPDEDDKDASKSGSAINQEDRRRDRGRQDSVTRINSSLCLPAKSNVLVYRSHASHGNSAYYQYAFETLGNLQNTHLYSWTVKEGQIGDFSEQHLSKDEFTVLTRTFKFKLLGSSESKFVQKFVRRSRKLPQKCGSRCSQKIDRLEKILRLREVNNRQCSQSTAPTTQRSPKS